MNEILTHLLAAYELMRQASLQSHTAHWDKEGTSGANCPECIRSRERREMAEHEYEIAVNLLKRESK